MINWIEIFTAPEGRDVWIKQGEAISMAYKKGGRWFIPQTSIASPYSRPTHWAPVERI